MAKEKFERSKPHLNIGTIGHIDHGTQKILNNIFQFIIFPIFFSHFRQIITQFLIWQTHIYISFCRKIGRASCRERV